MPSTRTDRIDGLSTSLAFKAPVMTATTAAITLSGEQTVAGVAVVDGDRVLVKDQSSAIDNGIYVVRSTAWSRAGDFDGARDVIKGTLVYVAGGTNEGKTYVLTTSGTITIGTSSINFSLVSISGDTLILSGALSAASAAITGAVSAASAALTGALTAASAAISGALTAASAVISGGVTAASINLGETSLTLYEEGTFTPALSFVTATYTAQTGRYRKVNDRIYIEIELDVATLDNTDSSDFSLTGIPACANAGRGTVDINLDASTLLNPTATDHMRAALASDNTARIHIVNSAKARYDYNTNNASAAKIFNTSGKIFVSATYLT